MPTPCVNNPLYVLGDGSLGVHGLRSVAWPYSGAISTNNGACVDPVTGNLWAPPEGGASGWATTQVGPISPSDGGNDRSGAFTGEIAATPAQSIVNTDANRSMTVTFIVTCDADVSTFGASIIFVRFYLSIPAGSLYVATNMQSSQYLSHSNAEGVGQHPSNTFSYGYTMGPGASITYNVGAMYSISAIANASQVVTLSLAGRAYWSHT